MSIESAPTGIDRSMSRWLLFAIPIALGPLPLFLVYLRNTWFDKPHYQFLPFLGLALVWLIYREWQAGGFRTFRGNWLLACGLIAGAVCGIVGTIFVYVWLAAACFCLVAAVTCVGSRSADGKSLVGLGALAFMLLTPPLEMDWQLIRELQRFSVKLSSRFLDLIGVLHHASGTTVSLPGGKEYFVEEACSGVQSFFTLVFVGFLLAAMRHGGLWRYPILLAFCFPLAVICNSIRITAIPLAEVWFGIDLTSGWKHDLVGYVSLGIGIVFVWSASRLTGFLGEPMRMFMSRVRRFLFRSARDNSSHGGRAAGSGFWLILRGTSLAVVWVLSVAVFCLQASEVGTLLSDPNMRLRFFDEMRIAKIFEQDLPGVIVGQKCVAFGQEDRSHGSELGKRTDYWRFGEGGYQSIVSIDQVFPGWHELLICYRNRGWKSLSREVITDGEGAAWPFVQATFEDDRGNRALLVFGLFDSAGKPIEPPKTWSGIDQILARMQNRVMHRLREQISQAEGYQVQVLVVGRDVESPETIAAARAQFFEARERLRGVVVERLKGE